MNNQLSIAKGDHNSTSTLNRAQKNANISVNIHLRTESNNQNQEPNSPDKLQAQLRQTFRRPRMPYNKLPEAFNMKNKKKKTNKEMIDNLDRIVKISEYRQIQELLEPISIESKAADKSKEHYANPLATIHQYFKMESRFRSKMEDLDRSSLKSKPLSIKQSNFRITECITLEIIKHRHNTGTLKKILHVPTMKLLTSKEQPLNVKDQRISLKLWLEAWQSHLNTIPQFLNLQGFLFNVPEGAISVITSYCQNGSLVNLLDSVFTLPQTVIRQIFLQVFKGLVGFYQVPDNNYSHFGGLSPSQILFNKQGKVKIGTGLYYHLSTNSSSSETNLYNLKSQPKQNIFDMNSTQKNFMKSNANSVQNKQRQRSYDVFKIGLMMLECAIGKLQNFQQSFIIQQAIKHIFTQEGQSLLEKQKVCCLVHSQHFLLQNFGQSNEKSRRDKVELSKIAPYSKYIKDRFSQPFQNFLCCSLKLIHSQRLSLFQLQKHSFLKHQVDKDTKTVSISLSDLLLINIDWSQDLLQSVQEDQCQRLITHILHVLSDCRKEVINSLIMNEKEKILEIGKYIGFNFPGIGDKLYKAILQISQLEKDIN